MSGKNQFPCTFNWQSTSPASSFLPANQSSGSPASGVINGVMSGSNTIYSQILEVSKMDNIGIEANWTGTPTGTLSIYASVSGANFYAITFSPSLGQPSGSAGGELISLNQFPWKYIFLQYTNSGGSGVLTAYSQLKDLN